MTARLVFHSYLPELADSSVDITPTPRGMYVSSWVDYTMAVGLKESRDDKLSRDHG